MKTNILYRTAARLGLRTLRLALAVGAAFLLDLSPASAGIRGLYVGSDFYPPSATTEANAKNSGFNRLFLFTGRVEANGNITYNDNLIVSNGVYVGNATWGSRLAAVKNDGRITRIEFCLGGWGNTAFNNIRDLVASQGTGSGSILYKNFQALKNALGVTAIQYDDEMTYHTSSAVAFGQMLVGLGYKVTLCPYNWGTRTFWQSVKSQLGANCDAIYLQCYDGGAGNNPADWNAVFGGFKVTPGLWGNTTSTKDCISKFRGWKTAGVCNGGFMWLNGNVQWDVDLWGDCLKAALEPVAFMMIVNKNSGKSIELIDADTSDGAKVNQWSYDYGRGRQRWALLPTPDREHFKIVSFISGRVLSAEGNSTASGAQIVARRYSGQEGQHWELVYVSDGWYKIKNVGSGLVLDISNSSTADGAKLQQWTDNGTNAQRFRLHPWGDYYIKTFAHKYLMVQGGGANGQAVVQRTRQNDPVFKWHFYGNGEGWERVSSLAALDRAISIQGGSQAAGGQAELRDHNPDYQAQKIRIRPLKNGKFSFYFKHSGMVWDIPGGQTADNVQMEQSPNEGYTRQQFRLERIF